MYHRSVGFLLSVKYLFWGHVEGIAFLILRVDVYGVLLQILKCCVCWWCDCRYCALSWNKCWYDVSHSVLSYLYLFVWHIWVYTSSTWYPTYNTSRIHGAVNRSAHNTIISDNTSHTSVPSLIFNAMMMVLHCREQLAMMQNILASFKLSWYFAQQLCILFESGQQQNVLCTNSVKLKDVILLLRSYHDVKTSDWNYWMLWCHLFTST